MEAPSRCVVCDKVVTRRQHALMCDGCDRWQHRLCRTGINQTDYRKMVRGELDIPFYCFECPEPEPAPMMHSTFRDDAGSRRQSIIPQLGNSSFDGSIATMLGGDRRASVIRSNDVSYTSQPPATAIVENPSAISALNESVSNANESSSEQYAISEVMQAVENPSAMSALNASVLSEKESSDEHYTFSEALQAIECSSPISAHTASVHNASNSSSSDTSIVDTFIEIPVAYDTLLTSGNETEDEEEMDVGVAMEPAHQLPTNSVTPTNEMPQADPSDVHMEEEEAEQNMVVVETDENVDGVQATQEASRNDSFRHPGQYNREAGQDPEDSLRETPPEALLPDQPIAYEIIPGGTVKGGDLLADNQGYTYARSRRRPRVTTWTCSNRGKKCAATVRQTGDTFERGSREHNHTSNIDRTHHARARALVSNHLI